LIRTVAVAELHDVQAALAQCRTDRRRRVGFTCRDLQLDKADNLLCHLKTSLERQAAFGE